MSARARLKNLSQDRRGAAMLEFALVAPLMVALVCGLAEFGLMLREYHGMQKAVREAGRFLSREQAASCSVDAYATVLASWTNPGDAPVQVESVLCELPAGLRGDAVVTVRSEVDYDDIDLGLLALVGLEPPTLRVEHQQVVIGA